MVHRRLLKATAAETRDLAQHSLTELLQGRHPNGNVIAASTTFSQHLEVHLQRRSWVLLLEGYEEHQKTEEFFSDGNTPSHISNNC